MQKNKIGVGLITFNRPDYYSQVIDTIPRHVIDTFVIVNDGTTPYAKEKDADTVLYNNNQLGVSKTKNKAITALLERGCNHIFLVEDDMIIQDKEVFKSYIHTAKSTGIHHLCFSRVEAMANNPVHFKYTHTYDSGNKIDLFHNPIGSFMYINSVIIKKFGMLDENYFNAFEHIDFAYNLILKGLMPPFWYFPDVHESDKLLSCVPGSAKESTITDKENYNENVKKSANHFIKKWNTFTSNIPDVGITETINRLKFIEKNYKINE